jgi:hypothetical protein
MYQSGTGRDEAIHLIGKAVSRFYEPDLTVDPDSPFVRDASNKLVRRAYWMDMTDKATSLKSMVELIRYIDGIRTH